ncbi:energy-coupling factor transporter ATP-binding protein EcfA2 [Saccharopolyspora lacisalsi]|uniref:Energy-coupling factor transporter ATP-binding protein EcfA2 n=1 Tax=Halosaccharopolyspora lacisalsi TaxID=1000566 RepID=A0A839DZV0_9PSEU|nr:hypothetical protein [Halosaccharopolyspora lacisalsi]MBA8825017.1 energy-coupling factor transporter ATP-binding protein EcfA2 [Halosaccharopolyspora lacisalsi]
MSEVRDPWGPVHTGGGDQYVMNLVAGATRQARGARGTALDDLRWLKRRFVPPEHLGAARSWLSENRTVLLAGPLGSGRRTAAKMLLNELTDEDGSFRILQEELELDPAEIGVRYRLLLDLSHSDEETFRRRQRELPGFRAALQRCDAHIVVVLPDGFEHHVDPVLSSHVVRIDRPRSQLVLQRHLEAEDIQPIGSRLGSTDLKSHLSGPMEDVAELVRLVVRVRDTGREGGLSAWLDEAVMAMADRSDEVAQQLKDHSSGRERAVLFAAAMCRGSSSDTVFFAAQGLLESLELTEEERPRLEQRGYVEQLDGLEIEVGAHSRVGFSRVAYDRTVRAHFWDNYPDLRRSFCQWVDRVIRLDWLEERERRDIVERFLEQALRTGCVGHVMWLIEQWTRPDQRGGPTRWMQFAAQALVTGLNDERHGARFRELVRGWSREFDLADHVGQLLVHVCTEVVAPNFPEQALVRLHQRARRENGAGAPTARQALCELTAGSRMLFHRLLDQLMSGFRDRQWQIDPYLFLDVIDPWRLTAADSRSHPLAADASVRSQLVYGWYTVMTHRPDLAWPVVGEWLPAAGQIAVPDMLLSILVEAACYDVRLLGSLHVVARNWSLSAVGRPDVAARLSRFIDMAQGIHSAEFTFRNTAEEAIR